VQCFHVRVPGHYRPHATLASIVLETTGDREALVDHFKCGGGDWPHRKSGVANLSRASSAGGRVAPECVEVEPTRAALAEAAPAGADTEAEGAGDTVPSWGGG